MITVELEPFFQLRYSICSIAVKEEITEPLSDYFSYRLVSFVPLLLSSTNKPIRHVSVTRSFVT